ncbi:MAG: plasma-membrane proton-efflux P-type ATPase [Candidatus Korarchaeota archaeon NZ13-K]|nr:MAG: plasma-membrane proton-efflux P-type ATPase [Candidatus Korarchaeota archaeon NZ13-K]
MEADIEEILRTLGSSPRGLSEEEAERRLRELGPNEVTERKENPLLKYLRRYWGPLPWLMEATAILSYLTGRVLEAGIMIALLVMNATLGHLHARSSRRAIESLRRRLRVKVSVLRDGRWVEKDARELVPGDVIFLRLGSMVPADSRIIEGELLVDQSALTGESLPVERRRGEILFSGSLVKRGEAKCVVVSTGSRTYYGRTIELVKSADSRSLQEETILTVMRNMFFLGVIGLAIAFAVGIYEGWRLFDLISLGIVFLMSSVPVALPAVLTILQAYGAIEMSRRGILVTRLGASEDLAAVDVMCFDKTGTLTLNRLRVAQIDALNVSEEKLLEYASCVAREESLDPLELAIIERTRGIGVGRLRLLKLTPFDPSLKRREATVEEDGRMIRIALGEPHTILGLCEQGEAERRFLEEKLSEASSKGLRTLAVAAGNENDPNLRFLGLIHMLDPPRPESGELIRELRDLGVRPMMLTGDNEAVAREIARLVGLGEKVISVRRIREGVDIEELDGLAEVLPEDKFDIVRGLQQRGHIVAVTGDGVNDAPALSQADVGIAVEGATDAAKSAASIVLVRSGLSVIVDAVRISRVIHERALTWVVNKIVKILQTIGVMLLAMLWIRRMALTPLDMALLLIANDFLTMSIATDNQTPSKKPARWEMRRILEFSLPMGLLYVIPPLAVLWLALHLGLDWSTSRGMLLLSLIYTSQFRILQARERGFFWRSRPGRELILSMLGTSSIFTLMALAGFIVPRLTLGEVSLALALSSTILLTDPLKVALANGIIGRGFGVRLT